MKRRNSNLIISPPQILFSSPHLSYPFSSLLISPPILPFLFSSHLPTYPTLSLLFSSPHLSYPFSSLLISPPILPFLVSSHLPTYPTLSHLFSSPHLSYPFSSSSPFSPRLSPVLLGPMRAGLSATSSLSMALAQPRPVSNIIISSRCSKNCEEGSTLRLSLVRVAM
jgi:hypothetical protein